MWEEFVAPLVGAWIEIKITAYNKSGGRVAPLVGAWIEINLYKPLYLLSTVAPLVGAWIEIGKMYPCFSALRTSLPSWERGLKYYYMRHTDYF